MLRVAVWLAICTSCVMAQPALDELARDLIQQQEQIDQGTLRTCPSNYNQVDVVGPGCSCNPVPALGAGLCPAGYVCVEPWTARLLHAAQNQPPDSKSDGEFPEFKCHPCTYGQLCPKGSSLPALSSNVNVARCED